MKHLLFAFALAASVTASGAGCAKKDDHAAATAGAKPGEAKPIATVTIDELDGMLAKGACTPVDANGDTTRQKKGVIPGAIRLTDYETYSAGELPADKAKPLVFYCANEQCGASHTAAEKAIVAGYRDVRVLPAGIMGWAQAGKVVEPGA